MPIEACSRVLCLTRQLQYTRPWNISHFPQVQNLFRWLAISTAEPWLTYTAWKKTYGDLLHVRLLGQSFVILDSEKTARALLDQHSALYLDCPASMVHLNSLFSMGFSTVMLPYGDGWRLHRELFQHAFRAESEARNREAYLRRARTLLANLLDVPEDFEAHIRRVMTLVDLHVTDLSPVRGAILHAFPFLVKSPIWLPGAALWRDAVYAKKLAAQVLDVPFDWVKDHMVQPAAPPSLVADCLAELDYNDDHHDKQEHAIKSTAATVFPDSRRYSSSTLHAFILAMVLCPEVQAKAQAELDSVIGSGRLPQFDDRASLPYVDAFLHELVRWNPLVPLGVPHATSSDDMYGDEDYDIPKGTVVLINVWPERFLSEEGTLKDGPPISANPIFGLGRHICVYPFVPIHWYCTDVPPGPGRFASEAFVWAAAVSILATFRITKMRMGGGREVKVKRQFTTGFVLRPVQFPCMFIRRSDERVEAVRDSVTARDFVSSP
ncbi:cytochrome P450 [Boletus reticuloceps]|uniref:Cytochrome P450 n=1 Tax=Boletus reticuloceps TaxID=495285 RepID=A0A8I2YJY9_9AGAM|nr:cytochrome P450 [Boletus reticuloceps]